MKYFILFIVILLSGCEVSVLTDPSITNEVIESHKEICDNNGGIHRYHLQKYTNYSIYAVRGIVCNNGAIFIFNGNGDENEKR